MTQEPTAPQFNGLRVASFESRRHQEMHQLIERAGGIPFVSPSMREEPLEDTTAIREFAHQLATGHIDVVIVMTGVGFRILMEAVQASFDGARFAESLADVTTIARGPKPVAAMREFGLRPTHRVPEPNTWRETIQTVDQFCRIENQTVAVQEYGVPNPSLMAGLEARGATVLRLPVYRWELPEQTDLLQQNIERLTNGELDVTLWTSANQVRNFLPLGSSDEFGRAGPRIVSSGGRGFDRSHHQRAVAGLRHPRRPRTFARENGASGHGDSATV